MDAETLAAQALIDARQEEQKSDFVEFNCPQCDEPVKLALEHAGKRHPCPECKRIILVPVPQSKKESDWRDTGPKLPSGARRDTGPAPEGAWGASAARKVSDEALLEAGVIKEKEKPLTFAQKARGYVLVGVPTLLLLVAGLWGWHWWTSTQEIRAFNYALKSAASPADARTLGAEGLMALHGAAGDYYIHSQKAGCGPQARQQYQQAQALAKASRSPASEALLSQQALAQLELAGDRDETNTERKINWQDTHKLIRATLDKIGNRLARLEALHLITTALVRYEQTDRVLALTAQLYTSPGADRAEAYGMVGLSLYALDHKEEARKALTDALAPYADPKKQPVVRGPALALAILLGGKKPEPDKSIEDAEEDAIGTAMAKVWQNDLAAARKAADSVAIEGGSRARVQAAMALAAVLSKNAEAGTLVGEAIDAFSKTAKHPALDWPRLRLVRVALENGQSAEKLEGVIGTMLNPEMQAWARWMVVRQRLEKSTSVEPEDVVSGIPAQTLAGKVARLELARHNTNEDRGWASTVNKWDDGLRALGSLGVALGMQGTK